ncbi:hypothetical protein CEXT_393851 [Caerostris extrusa]|uniref:Uncharacterized protein n=1 Tax=Caerostris extrusa TaxID=172846 RepID=A0AAV4RIK7_CAEEX|nr:hypothetical protein CEXT_393851 [Caerostris extrusa]
MSKEMQKLCQNEIFLHYPPEISSSKPITPKNPIQAQERNELDMKDKVTRRNASTKYFLVLPEGHNETQQCQILKSLPEEQRRIQLSTGRKCYENVAKGTSGENGTDSKMAGKDSLAIENSTDVPERDFSSG